MTPGRTWKEKVVLKGDFTLPDTITLPSYTILEILGKLTLGDGLDRDLIYAKSVHDVEVIGGILDGNKANNPGTVNGVHIDGTGVNLSYDVIIRGVKAQNCKTTGITVEYTIAPEIVSCQATLNTHGIWTAYTIGGEVRGCDAYSNTEFGIVCAHGAMVDVKYSSPALIGCTAKENGASGFELTYGGRRAKVIGCTSYLNTQAGFLAYGSDENTFVGCVSYGNGTAGMQFLSRALYDASNRQRVEGCLIFENTGSGILSQTWINTILNNHIHDNGAFGLDIAANGALHVTRNTFEGNTGGPVNDATGNNEYFKNAGFVTENKGTANITGAVNLVTVAHGLAGTPDHVFVTPRQDSGDVWADTLGAANFNINFDVQPGAATWYFDWEAEFIP